MCARREAVGLVCVCAIYLKFKVDDATCYHNPLLLIVLVGCWKYIPGRRLLQCLSPFPHCGSHLPMFPLLDHLGFFFFSLILPPPPDVRSIDT